MRNGYSYRASVSGCSAGTSARKPRAVVSAGNYSFGYDCNGNQTSRSLSSGTYTLSYDAENRLKEVRKNGNLIASFTYDADGKLVKRWDGQITVYIGELYQRNLSTGQETQLRVR